MISCAHRLVCRADNIWTVIDGKITAYDFFAYHTSVPDTSFRGDATCLNTTAAVRFLTNPTRVCGTNYSGVTSELGISTPTAYSSVAGNIFLAKSPEPSTWALAGLGLLVAVMARGEFRKERV